MKEVIVEKIEDFKKFVETMEVNTRYLLPDTFKYKWIRIEMDNEYYSKEVYFGWAMEYNYKVAGSVGYIYPLSNTNMVTHFKTEKGAKRNFIKRYADYFEPLCV